MNGCGSQQSTFVANTQEEQERPNTRSNAKNRNKNNKSKDVSEKNQEKKRDDKTSDRGKPGPATAHNAKKQKLAPVVELPSLSAAEKEKYITPQRREPKVTSSEHSSASRSKDHAIGQQKPDVRGTEGEDDFVRKVLSGVKPIDTATYKPPQPPSKFPEERVSNEPKQSKPKGDNSKKKPLDGSIYMGPEDVIAARIAKETLNMPLGDLCALQPKLVKALDRQTKNRVLAYSKLKTSVASTGDSTKVDSFMTEDAVLSSEAENREVLINVEEIHTSETFKVLQHAVGDLPEGAIVQLDPVDQFNADTSDCPDGVKRMITIVASTTEGLRVVFPKINGSNLVVEVVTDSGSQIISMDSKVAKSLELTWDPDTVIRMQSSNGGLNTTRGLARNVPFKFGDIVLYLQVHIVDNAPYQVLLGRPFDMLASTKVSTDGDDTEIEITCPNTKRRVTIPTFRRGTYRPPRHEDPVPQTEADAPIREDPGVNFQSSRI